MSRYFLTRICIEGFRGINNEDEPLELRFNPGTVNSVFALNGAGKSSIFEALAFAVSGSVPKLDRLRNDERPQEYLANKFHSQGAARIELDLTTDDSTPETAMLRVDLDSVGNRTVTSPSGHHDPESLLRLLNEDFVLLDHNTFRSFVEGSPLARGRSFSSLLGLADYSSFRQALQTAADTRVVKADFEIGICEARVDSLEDASRTAVRSMGSSYEAITGKGLTDTERLDECKADVVAAFSAIPLIRHHVEEIEALEEMDFDQIRESIRVSEKGPEREELSDIIRKLRQLSEFDETNIDIDAEHQRLTYLQREWVGQLELTRGERCRHLYEAASALVEGEQWPDFYVCPLCESRLHAPIDTIVHEHMNQYATASEKLDELRAAWREGTFRRRLHSLEQHPAMEVSDEERTTTVLDRYFQEGQVDQRSLDTARAWMEELETKRTGLVQGLRSRKDELERLLPPSMVSLTEQVEAGRQFTIADRTYQDSVKKLEEARRVLDVRKRWIDFISRAATAFAEAEVKRATHQIELISADYKEMFRRVMFVQDVTPDLRRADRGEDLYIELKDFHGLQDVSARALLSESFRNALAISIYLAAAMRHRGAPRFLVLDDVTSSFDSGHQYYLMELIRTSLQYRFGAEGLQFIILSHDGQLEKYFDHVGESGDWKHQRLQGAPPLGMITTRGQGANRLKDKILSFLNSGQVQEAQPLMRQYLEFRLMQVIRKVNVPVPLDFVTRDQKRVVSNCLDAITEAVRLHERAGTLVLEPNQLSAITSTHVPALIGNWVSHYETASVASFTPAVLHGVVQSIDDFCDCFQYDRVEPNGTVTRVYYRSLSAR